MVQLGDRVKDKVTGFCGLVIARTTWLNGCVRIGVQNEKLKEWLGMPQETQWIDELQLIVVKSRVVNTGIEAPGGPTPTPKRALDPRR